MLSFRQLHDRENAFRDIYATRCNKAVFAFKYAVEELKHYKLHYSQKWFSLPLKCAESLHELCLEIQEGLAEVQPDFHHLMELGSELLNIQRNQFIAMGRVAYDNTKHDGFCVSALVSIYEIWDKILKGTYEPRGRERFQFRFNPDEDHKFWKVFTIKNACIFDNNTTQVGELVEIEPEDRVEVRGLHHYFGEMKLNARVHMPGSCSITPVSSYESLPNSDDDTYLTFNRGEFREFEREWERIEESRQDNANPE
ncbi:hypothetical protein CRE_14755 [Caenorhabditis remanei]|uniref:Uncharacterized protein n=1 Tax=Caenorhabditis remanei TaxID=31234 RepID=E3MRR4_CAERE|nr:hypothetical protein CRE_14755 [Caenorhabditis remanei]